MLGHKKQEYVNSVKHSKDGFPFYCSTCLKIQTKDGKLISFDLNRAQLMLFNMVYDDMLNGKPVRYIILKARQLGISTLIEALIFWLTSLNKNRGALITAHDKDSVENLFEKEKVFFNNYPDDIKPMVKAFNQREIHFANPDPQGQPGLNSKIIIKTAESELLGRSFTLQFAHLSEFAFWDSLGYEPNKRLNSINQSIADKPGTFIFIESTANGDSYFKTLWDRDTEGYVYNRVFISWVVDEDYRKPVTEYFVLEDNEQSIFGDETTEYTYIEQQLNVWYPELEGIDLIDEIYARLNWRRYAIINKCEESLELFRQEYPTIPEQAFAASGSNYFSSDKLNKMKDDAQEFITYHYNNDVSDRLKSLSITKFSDSEVIKEIVSESFIQTVSNYGLRVYDPPCDGKRYVVGVDTSEGLQGRDPSGLVVLECSELLEVATYSEIIDPAEFARIVFCVSWLYNKAFLGIEDNDRGASLVIDALTRDIPYYNMYQRRIFESRKHNKFVDKYGWKTTGATKPIMIGVMRDYINDYGKEDKGIVLQDKKTIRQLKLYTKFEDGKSGCPLPEHDDLAMAAMIALQMTKVVPKQGNVLEFNKPQNGSWDVEYKKYKDLMKRYGKRKR